MRKLWYGAACNAFLANNVGIKKTSTRNALAQPACEKTWIIPLLSITDSLTKHSAALSSTWQLILSDTYGRQTEDQQPCSKFRPHRKINSHGVLMPYGIFKGQAWIYPLPEHVYAMLPFELSNLSYTHKIRPISRCRSGALIRGATRPDRRWRTPSS